MAMMIAPNGVEVDASEHDEPIFRAAGYTYAQPADKQADAQAVDKPKRGRPKKAVSDNGQAD